ncbi:hypothetical protein L3X38_003237 [Prunus dulcis]|uniref:Retroviral polymerase SH3-like domain-containing protein n=1 Tax=Prunus dulcis TaxID=3755 RepID=A0AAD4ZLN6_PRUDU|nr:hypothetical protein L3X38_003237 [Prunus dulcis]
MLVPGLDENLLGGGQMVEHGYYLVFGNSVVDIFDDKSMENLVAKVSMTGNRCFPLSLKYANSVAMKAIVEESTCQLRSKLEDAAEKCIFVGYGKCEKGYRVYNLQTNKVTTSRSVIFDENSLWDWDKQTVDSIRVPMRLEDTSISCEKEYEETMIDNIFSQIQVTTAAVNADSPSASPSSTPVKLRDITEIYARCNMSIIEPENFAEASKDKAWQKAMEIEMEMI